MFCIVDELLIEDGEVADDVVEDEDGEVEDGEVVEDDGDVLDGYCELLGVDEDDDEL